MDGKSHPALDRNQISALVAAVKDCTRLKDLERGQRLHSLAFHNGLLHSNIRLCNTLLNMYVKCGRMSDARGIFDRMQRRNPVSYNTLIMGYAQKGDCELALELFQRIESPTSRSFVAAFKSYARLAAAAGDEEKQKCFEKALDLHREAAELGFDSDIFVASTLIDMYAKLGKMTNSRRVFDCMVVRNIVSWNALLQGYADNGFSEVTLELFDRLLEVGFAPNPRTYVAALTACATLADRSRLEGKRIRWLEKGKEIHAQALSNRCCDMFVESSLMNLYGKCGSMDLARRVFDAMLARDIVSWNAMIMGYVENGEDELVLAMIREMDLSGAGQDATTLKAALKVCGRLMDLEKAKLFHGEVLSRGLLRQDEELANCLVDLYSKFGDMEVAKRIFDEIGGKKTLVSWNSLMHGYGLQGDSERVFASFVKMRGTGLQPDEITFVCLLSACNHAGLTDRGREFFEGMDSEYGVKPTIKHYGCMVDLLGRANLLEEAFRLVRSMDLEAGVSIWCSLLNSCLKWGNFELGREAYEALLRRDEGKASAYVMMANICEKGGEKRGGDQVIINSDFENENSTSI